MLLPQKEEEEHFFALEVFNDTTSCIINADSGRCTQKCRYCRRLQYSYLIIFRAIFLPVYRSYKERYSLSHILSHTLFLTHSLLHVLSHTHPLSFTFLLSHFSAFSHSLISSLSLSLSAQILFSCCLSHSLLTHSLTCFPSRLLSPSYTVTLSLSLSLAHFFPALLLTLPLCVLLFLSLSLIFLSSYSAFILYSAFFFLALLFHSAPISFTLSFFPISLSLILL